MLHERQRIFEIEAPEKRYQVIAADYLRFHRADERTLVVSPANSERRELNRVIRETLIEHSYVPGPAGSTGYWSIANSPEPSVGTAQTMRGDVIRFTRASNRIGIPKNAYLTVEAVNRRTTR